MATDFGILGELRVLQDGHPADLGPPRQRALLTRLLIGPTMVSADRLIEDLWAGDPPDSARHVLHVYVSRLRRTLGDDGARLERQGSGYRLRFEADELDARQFENLVGQARSAKARGDVKAASEQLRSALELWRGPALVEFTDEAFAREEAARLEELRVAAIEGRVWADLELGQALELVDELEALVSGHPYREGFAEQLMLALYRCGRQVEALRVYQSQRGRLAEDLGIDPGPALQRLQERVLAQDTELLATPGPRAARDRRHLPLQRTSFVGREQELREAGTLLARSRVLTLTGPPGAGKTRLGLRVAEQSDGFQRRDVLRPACGGRRPPLRGQRGRYCSGPARIRPRRRPWTLTRAFLSERRVLLLLDNFEHVMEAARQVGDLLDSAPDLQGARDQPLTPRAHRRAGVPRPRAFTAAGRGGARRGGRTCL